MKIAAYLTLSVSLSAFIMALFAPSTDLAIAKITIGGITGFGSLILFSNVYPSKGE